MLHRVVGSIGLIAALVVAPSAGRTVAAQARPPAPKAPSIPRTPDGKPDLQGAWSFANVTPFERPAALGEKAVLSDDEVAQIEEQAAASSKQDEGRKRGTAADVGRAYNDFWYDRGTKRCEHSPVVDRRGSAERPRAGADRRGAGSARARERPRGNSAARPMAPRIDRSANAAFSASMPARRSRRARTTTTSRSTQTKDFVVVMTEMVHDARIVPLDGRKHLPSSVRPWMGDSRGRWEGDTLVVETTNFSEKNLYRNASPNLKLVEKFTRIDARHARSTSSRSTIRRHGRRRGPDACRWRGSTARSYEYACHEGNLGMEGILKGTRAEETGAGATRQ